jgi:lipopolysaccharide transport system permease protein
MSDVTIIENGRKKRDYWLDMWRYRELFYVLAWRDLAVRYKQTIVGAAWAFIRPFLTMVVFTVIFSRIAKLPSDGVTPYPLMVFVGTLPWTFFSTGLSDASNSLIGNSNLVSKVYFPRLILPTASVVVAFVDFLVAFVILVGMMAWYRFLPSWHIVALPIVMLFAFAATMGPSLWVTAINVKYRDFRIVVPFIVQLGLYVSPVGFSSNIVPDQWRLLYSFNPIVGVIDAFRWCLLGGQSQLYLPGMAASLFSTALLCWLGMRRFRNTENSFADLI